MADGKKATKLVEIKFCRTCGLADKSHSVFAIKGVFGDILNGGCQAHRVVAPITPLGVPIHMT